MSIVYDPKRRSPLVVTRCDERGCRRVTTSGDRRFDQGWEVLGGVMNTYDFCSEAHLLAYQARCPDWYERDNI